MTKEELTTKLERDGILKTPEIKKALLRIDRRDFVPKDLINLAYEDIPLPIGDGQTISQPGTVAFMLELLQPQEGDKILEVGAGSGWVTALLAQIVGESGFIYSYEINRKVAGFGLENLGKTSLKNYRYTLGDAKQSWSKDAPYTKIIAGAAFPFVFKELYSLIENGGIIVIPTQSFDIKRIRKSFGTGAVTQESYYGFVFVPLK